MKGVELMEAIKCKVIHCNLLLELRSLVIALLGKSFWPPKLINNEDINPPRIFFVASIH